MVKSQRKQWRLVIQLQSPMQIGTGSLGMVEKTDMYIPGRVLWGALTATLVRQNITRSKPEDYIKVGEALGPHEIFFSSFFPSFDKGDSEWLPVFEGNKRSWVKCCCKTGKFNFQKKRSEEEMQSMLISGQSGNATDPKRMATFDKSLHETDILSPLIKNGKSFSPVYFTGIMQLPHNLTVSEEITINIDKDIFEPIFSHCRLGGGRKRGWGIVRLVSLKSKSSLDESLSVRNYSGGNLLITSPTHFVKDNVTALNGRAFLATYRQYCNKKGQGRGFTSSQLCWEAGTLIPRLVFDYGQKVPTF